MNGTPRAQLRVLAVVALLTAPAMAGCGKTQARMASTAQAKMVKRPWSYRTPAFSVGDPLCASTATRIRPLVDRLAELPKSGLGEREIDRQSALLLERIAEAPRVIARRLRSVRMEPRDDTQLLAELRTTLFRMAAAEDRLAAAYREHEPSHVAHAQAKVASLRRRAQREARFFGFLVCGAGARPPVA
jgi:hypothetical protein